MKVDSIVSRILKGAIALSAAGVLTLGLAGGAFATTASFGTAANISAGADNSAARTIAAESFGDDYDVNLDSTVVTINDVAAAGNPLNPAGDFIGIETTWGAIAGDIITFQFTGASFMDGSAFLLAEEANQPTLGATDLNGDGDATDVIEVASNFGVVDTVNGVTTVEVRVNDGLSIPTGAVLILTATNGGLENGATDGLIDDDTDNPTLRIPAGTAAGATVSVAVSAQTAAGVAIPAASAAANLFDIENQFNVGVQTAATSTVDVEAGAGSRLNFVEEGGVNDVLTTVADTDLTRSAALVFVDNDSDGTVEDFITTVAADALTLTLTGEQSQLVFGDATAVPAIPSGVYLELVAGGNGTTDNNSAFHREFASVTANTADATIAGNVVASAAPAGSVYTDDLVITIDGVDPIATRAFTLAAALDFNSAQYVDQTYAAATSHTWDINGMQAKVPYVYHVPGGDWDSILRVTNEGANPAEVLIDAIVVDIATGVNTVQNNVTLGTVAAASAQIFGGEDIATALGLDTAAVSHFSLTVTVIAPQNSVHLVAQQKSPNARSDAPVLYNTGNGLDDRQWQ
jgi:hypothetical protein